MAHKIVVIDDDKVTRKLLTEILTRNGYEAHGAHDGAEGVALVKWERPDLVLTDLLIPIVDGIGVCQQIKSEPELSGTKVIVMSALKNPVLVREARAAGADDFIDKPIRTDALLELLRRLLPD
ncbi:MAG: response regulator [Candidatus Aminicenantes bacterium]|nr:response regulator [Candidatus Aminicenantes bacterium]